MDDLIRGLRNIHDGLFEAIESALDGWFTGLVMRLAFASVTFQFFIASALTKVVDRSGAESAPFDYLTVEAGALAQIAPKAFEAAGYDPSQVGIGVWLISYGGTYAEFVLPVLLLIGLFTRLAAVGMIGFIAVMTWVDVTGHGALTFDTSKLFDRLSTDVIMDQRLLWMLPLIYLVIKGAGAISVDAVLGRPARRVALA